MAKFLIVLIKIYQNTISKVTRSHCRFYPTCSEYSLTALKRFGFWKGFYLSVKRIIRCHPWNKGGFDPVPKNYKGR